MSYSSTEFGKAHPRLRRIEALQKGELSPNDITLLCQEIIEAGEMDKWGLNVFNLCAHQTEMGLCTYTLRIRQ